MRFGKEVHMWTSEEVQFFFTLVLDAALVAGILGILAFVFFMYFF